MDESKCLFFCMVAVACFIISLFFFAEINGVLQGLKKELAEFKKRLKDDKHWLEVLENHDKLFEQYDRFLKWNSMLDTSYRTNGMVCAFRYKGERKIEFCRYNPDAGKMLPLELYDFPGTATINERMFDAWLPCIGGVAPVGEKTLPQHGYDEEGWIEDPAHEPSCT